MLDGRLENGRPIAILPDGPEVQHPTEPGQTIKSICMLIIDKHKITFAELVDWLAEMGQFAEIIANHDPSNSKPVA
jgi:hypothetical protein